MPTSPKKKDVWKLRLETAGRVFESEGSSVLEALEKLEAPAKITVKGELKVSFKDRESVRYFTPIALRRFFRPIARPFHAKNLEYGLQ